MTSSHQARGFGYIETVVGTALMLVVFLSLFGLLKLSIQLTTLEKAQGASIAIAQSQMEYLRGFSYDSLGTVGGIPGGSIAQTTTTSVDGITFNVRTLIEYRDDAADGSGGSDTNGIITDYKIGKVTVSYSIASSTKSTYLISNFVPASIETSTGGGTLRIVTVNKTAAPVVGASIHIVNASTASPVDLTTFSDAAGIVYLPGAATSSEYQVSVSKSGYSTAQTYARAGSNQNPNPGYLTVSQNQTTTGTFAIDLLGTLILKSYAPSATSTFSDTFASSANIAATSSTIVSGGDLTLQGGATSGSARSVSFAPQYLSQWGEVNATLDAPTDTTAAVQVYDGAGVLLPNGVLPGNSSGFTSFPLNLSTVSTSTYPSLALGALLTTATTSAPAINTWSLTALAGPTPLPNVSFTLTGTKTIGTTGGGAAIYKTVVSDSTGAAGSVSESLEWDGYSLDVSSYDLVDACPAPPYSLDPGATLSASLVLGAPTTHRLLVAVEDSSGTVVTGASVTLSKTGYSSTESTSSCGNAYFGSLSAATYTIQISKAGYTTTTFNNVAVLGQTFYVASFP